MFRQSPRRNGRNKGLKVKHVLQISLLLGVSIWLLYQVHHSDDKKPSVQSNITKKLHNVVNKDMFRLGRKDLQPKINQPNILHDKKEPEEHQTDEGGNETEPEDLVHDHESEEHEDMKHEEDRENEEENTELEHEQIKIKMKKIEVNRVNEKTISNMKVENVLVGVGPSVDVSIWRESKKESKQEDLKLVPSVDNKSEILVNRNLEDSNGENENEKEQELNENENENNEESEVKNEEGGVLEEEKEALTDLGTLPESGISGSRSNENTAAE